MPQFVKASLPVIIGLIETLLLADPQDPGNSDSNNPKQAILGLLHQQETAWNRGDLEGFMSAYWKSPFLSFFSGKERTTGWQETLERYRRRYQGQGQEMGILHFRDLEVDVVGPQCTLVRGRWELSKRGQSSAGLFSLVLKRFSEGWRIVHDHTSG
jgi:beta-aspartyl-peptidase (threonine type)